MNPEQWAFFMDQALDLARQAEALGEIPVGALVVKEGKILGRGFNRRETDADATAHAVACAQITSNSASRFSGVSFLESFRP